MKHDFSFHTGGQWHKKIESRFNKVEQVTKVKYPPLKIKRWWAIYRASPYAYFFFWGNTATHYMSPPLVEEVM